MSEDIVATRVAERRLAPWPWKSILVAAVVLIGLALLSAFDPAASGIFPPCPFHAMTGLHCPGCGTMRALHQLLHGNLLAAFSLNPLMMLSLPWILYGLVSACVRRLGGRQLPTVFVPAAWIWALLAVVVVFAVLRNVPFYPLNLLAPTG